MTIPPGGIRSPGLTEYTFSVLIAAVLIAAMGWGLWLVAEVPPAYAGAMIVYLVANGVGVAAALILAAAVRHEAMNVRRQEVVAACSLQLAQARSSEALAEIALRHVGVLVPGCSASVVRRTRGDSYRRLAAAGAAMGVLRSDESICTADLVAAYEDPSAVPDCLGAIIAELGAAEARVLPLVDRGRVLGAMVVGKPARGTRLRELAEPLGAIARQLAGHLAVATLLEAQEAWLRTGALLDEIGDSVSETLDVPTIAQAAAQGLACALGADRVVIAVSAGSGEQVLADTEVCAPPLLLQPCAWNQEGGASRAICSPDLEADHRLSREFTACAIEQGYRAALVCPAPATETAPAVCALYRRPREVRARDLVIAERVTAELRRAWSHAEAYEQLRRAQAELVEAARAKALGSSAAAVAHGFNNLLAAVLGQTQLLQCKGLDDSVAAGLSTIERVARDGAEVVKRLQAYCGLRPSEPPEPVPVAPILREAITIVRLALEAPEAAATPLAFEIREAEEGLSVLGSASELRHCLLDLLRNAAEAMPAGGTVTVAVERDPEHGRIRISVADSGIGIAADVLDRIFDPFFTTKGPGAGGLGLSVTKGLVEARGGRVLVQSAAGEGSTFTIELPQAPASTTPASDARVQHESTQLRVLLVEDEEFVREPVETALSMFGHTVRSAADGPRALELMATEEFDVAITDIAMPGMSGWDLAARLNEAAPDLPIVVMTGWGDSSDAPPGVDIARFLVKPVDLYDLRDVVSTLGARKVRR